MKHLQSVRDAMGGKFIEVDDNKVAFTIQDGPINEVGVNGIQITEVLMFVKYIYEKLNKEFPCRENSLTITHIDEALNWQDRRTKDRTSRRVEGYNLE